MAINRAEQSWPESEAQEIPQAVCEFTANGSRYVTDSDTLALMRSYEQEQNEYMLAVVFSPGRDFEKIVKL